MDQSQFIRPFNGIFPVIIPKFPAQGPLISTTTIDGSCSFNIPVIIVSDSPYTAKITDYYIGVNNTTTAPFSVVLPDNSVVGKIYIIKDYSGNSFSYPITITATGHTIDGSASATIDSNYGSITLVFNGIGWSIV